MLSRILLCVGLTLLLSLAIIPDEACGKDCKVDSDCRDHEACMGNHSQCGDISVICRNPEYCGHHATCEARNHQVSCICKPGHSGTLEHPCVQPECNRHSDCPTNLTCTSSKHCEDPCLLATCGEHADCVTTNHVWSCQCSAGYQRIDPSNPVLGCRGCSKHSDCPTNLICTSSKHCEDPCVFATCGERANCVTTNHAWSCQCLKGYTRKDPGNPALGCKDIDVESEKLQVYPRNGWPIPTKELIFSLQTHSLAGEMEPLWCSVYSRGQFNATVKIETDHRPFTTVTHTYNAGHGYISPVSTMKSPVVLSPNTKYTITFSFNAEFTVFGRPTVDVTVQLYTLKFTEHDDFYVNPSCVIRYKTLAPQ